MKPNLMRSFSPVFKYVPLIAKVSLLSIVTIGGFQQVASASFAAIATGRGSNIWGDSWNYPTRGQAEAAALQKCGHESCRVDVWVENGCAAVVRHPYSRLVFPSWAYDRNEAVNNARRACGHRDCYVEVSDCTSRN